MPAPLLAPNVPPLLLPAPKSRASPCVKFIASRALSFASDDFASALLMEKKRTAFPPNLSTWELPNLSTWEVRCSAQPFEAQ